MANEEDSKSPPEPRKEGLEEEELDLQNGENPGGSSDSESESDSDEEEEDEEEVEEGVVDAAGEADEVMKYIRPVDESVETEDTPEANFKRFNEILNSRWMRRQQEGEDRSYVFYEDRFDFPKDPERWREEDLKELWADAPVESTKPGWDPVWADEEDWDIVMDEIDAGGDPPIAPFYIPYRKPYPAIPDNNYDVSNPKAVIEELDRIEEFLKWVSYIFPDGSTYEGTVWDDLAHGKGVYEAEYGLVRYEGEWLQNNMEGHGVLEVDIPDIEPVPGSKLEAKMRAEGRIIARDYMSPEDREWLEMDIEDSIRLAGGAYEIPFYENNEWIKQFGQRPEKGRYRYAGQWKHGRMHGCGVYEVNERTVYGRFYFGELLEDSTGCDENVSALHSGIAEVAAAKARMFVNKPDGMVREDRGPYNDPQHPYFYEEEDAWMAPGFINQFYEVPEYWKRYVHDVDQERGMWLNSFYKAPLRLPMPAELEYWWSKDQNPEFILINKEPDPENDDPSQRYPEDPLILHTPTGRIINYVEDEEHGIRLFWQPPLKDGEEVDPSKAEFLPLGFDDFYGREVIEKRESFWKRFVVAAENACRPAFERFDKWIEEKKKDGEMKMKLIEKELDLIEAEICLEEAIEEMDEDLKTREKEEQMMVEMGLQEEREETFELAKDEKKGPADVEAAEEAEEEEVEEEEEEEEDSAPSSFGNVTDISKNGQKRNKPGDLPFATSSLGLYPSGFISAVPSTLQRSFAIWKQAWSRENASFPMDGSRISPCAVGTVTFPRVIHQIGNLKASKQEHLQLQKGITSDVSSSQLRSLSRIISSHTFSAQWQSRPSLSASRKSRSRLKEPRPSGSQWLHEPPDGELSRILSLHDQAYCRGYPMETLASGKYLSHSVELV